MWQIKLFLKERQDRECFKKPQDKKNQIFIASVKFKDFKININVLKTVLVVVEVDSPGKLLAIVVVTCPDGSVDMKELFLCELFPCGNGGMEPGTLALDMEIGMEPGIEPYPELGMELGMEFMIELGGMGLPIEFGMEAGIGLDEE